MTEPKKYWYPTAFSHWGDEEQGAIDRVVDSGRFTMGAEVEAFEAEFAAYHGRRHGVMVNSGSSANLVAVAALEHCGRLGADRNDRAAVVPAVAWSTTYAPLVQHGFRLEVADVDDTWNVPIKNAMTAGGLTCTPTRLAVACPVLGNPAHMSDYIGVSCLLEDCCESLGARTASGVRCGAIGTVSTFSFFYSHQISAIEGGMILTDDDDLAEACRMLRAHGWTRGTRLQESGFDKEYDFRGFGYNVRPLEMHAAIAREQLKTLDDFVEVRRANLFYFWSSVDDLPICEPRLSGYASPFGIAFEIDHERLRRGNMRAHLVSKLRAAGIDARPPTGGSFLRHAYGAPYRIRDDQTPCADRLHDYGLFLGNAPYDISDKIDAAVRVLREVLR